MILSISLASENTSTKADYIITGCVMVSIRFCQMTKSYRLNRLPGLSIGLSGAYSAPKCIIAGHYYFTWIVSMNIMSVKLFQTNSRFYYLWTHTLFPTFLGTEKWTRHLLAFWSINTVVGMSSIHGIAFRPHLSWQSWKWVPSSHWNTSSLHSSTIHSLFRHSLY